MKLTKVALAVSTLLMSAGALAHGYVSEPASRDLLCQKGVNKDCGAAQYEPQSVGESPKGFPAAGTPPDGKLVSGNGGSESLGTLLNAQSSDRWAKHKMKAGKNTFKWHFTAVHATQDWKYFITKQDWNPNKPLTRDSFELVPFCVVPGNQQLPATDVSHECHVPERSGYQVIYANWEVSNTQNTFYKVIDAEFEDAIPSEWSQSIGTISPNKTLKAGDSVKTRVFGTDERPELSTTLTINSDAEGDINVWSKALAAKINAEQKDLRAGLKNKDGNVDPIPGLNTIYTRANSGLTRVEIEINAQADDQASMRVTGVEGSYTLADGNAPIDFNVDVTGELKVTAKLFDQAQTLVGTTEKTIEDSTATMSFSNVKLKAGKHSLVVIGSTKDGQSFQESFDIQLNESAGSADYEFTYPQSIAKYAAGTKVLQTKTNKVYECRPFPNSAWCVIHSSSDNAYEPGVGRAWSEAWIEVGNAKHQHE
ncbi:N-acetylglucosamine-binding protein GbpA [Pseudomonas cerasi]